MWDVWENGLFVGDNRPTGRVTIQKAVLKKHGPWRSLLFQQEEDQYEIPNVNIKSITIDRRLSTDAATMELSLVNQRVLDPNANLDLSHAGTTEGPSVRDLKDLGSPGYYSYRRGITPASVERWGHGVDPTWVDMFIPNRLIRTFQGYGTDGAVNPWDDTKLVLTGVWLIDSVSYSASGDISVSCRDLAKLLIEQRLYPPIIPIEKYPLEFCASHSESDVVVTDTTSTTTVAESVGTNVAKHPSTSPDSSVAAWYGYNGSVYGHKASHAFDGQGSSYWMSVGNSGPNQVWSYEWVEADTGGEPVNRIKFKPRWGGYVCYVSVKVGGVWQGTSVVPYGSTSGPAKPNGANIKYVKKVNVPANENWFTIDLPEAYNAQRVRLCFTNLANSGLGSYPYRAGVYEMEVFAYTAAFQIGRGERTETVVDNLVPGNITDYTDIVKIFASWSGFYWKDGPTDQLLEDQWGTGVPGLSIVGVGPTGRTWGDFAYSGAYPVDPYCIPASFWDNKSVMDGINQIKEILGFICYVDTTGGLVWRMPNIWRTGNFITGTGFIGEDSVRIVDETKVLIDFGVTIDDSNMRSEIIVVSADDPTLYTAIQPGFAAGEVVPSAIGDQGDLGLLGGQDRIMLVPNYPFVSQDEVDKFAYLVSLWIHWSYRKGKVRIPGNPAFEPDDQVRVFERTTSEAYIHYIVGTKSSMDLNAGTWYMDLDTNWLGAGPDQTWVVESYADMPPALFAYLVAIGEITLDTAGTDYIIPDGWESLLPVITEDPIRLDEDLDTLFPDPPTIVYAGDDSTSDYEIDTTVDAPGTVQWRSDPWKRQYWGPVCSDLITMTFMREWKTLYGSLPPEDVPTNTHTGQVDTVKVTIPRATYNAYYLMAEIFADEGYNVRPGKTGAFAGCDRMIAGTNKFSAHAWGLAIDINWDYNPCCSTPRSTIAAAPGGAAFLRAASRITSEIKTNNGNRVFGWGGWWTSKSDWMHFEVVVTKADILSGVHR